MFDHIVSLGWTCGVAAAMSKNGFRENSGPFDWMLSDLPIVLHFLENSFEGYLDRRYLKVNSESVFEDTRGIYYNHDCKKDLNKEYDSIYEKYQKRIQRFSQYKNICFIRSIRTQKEIEYIKQNEAYIRKVIGKNEIIFLAARYLDMDGVPFKYYILDICSYQGNYRTGLRDTFDKTEGLIEYLIENYPADKRKENLFFDLKKEDKVISNYSAKSYIALEKKAFDDVDRVYRRLRVLEENIKLIKQLDKTDFKKIKLPQEVDIYGTGDVGELLYEKIKDICKIRCFIDDNDADTEIEVIKPEEYHWMGHCIIVTTPFYIKEIGELLKKAGVEEKYIIPLTKYL